jgi:hypothetical protein
MLEMDKKSRGLALKPGLDQQVPGALGSVGRIPFLVDEFEHAQINEPGGVWQKLFEKGAQNGRRPKQYFESRIVVHDPSGYACSFVGPVSISR